MFVRDTVELQPIGNDPLRRLFVPENNPLYTDHNRVLRLFSWASANAGNPPIPPGNGVGVINGNVGLRNRTIITLSSTNRTPCRDGSGFMFLSVERWFNPTDYNNMTRSQLAQEIIDRYRLRSVTGRHIRLPLWSVNMTNANRRSAYMNLVDTAARRQARRSDVSALLPDGTRVPIGGYVHLQENLLRAILRVNDRFGTVTINSLAGGRHSPTSRHYTGRAVDFPADNSFVIGTSPLVLPQAIINYLRQAGFDTGRFDIGSAQGGSYSVPHLFHLEIHN